MYSKLFDGWIGKLDEQWSQENRRSLLDSLCAYYQKHISSGQKIFIGYDHHPSSKYLAIEATNLFAEGGIPVFISNRPLTSSMIHTIALERCGCGSLSFTRDDYAFPYVGLKASKPDGSLLSKKDIENVGNCKKHKKQNIDWFDPIPNLKNYIETKFDLLNFQPSHKATLWNAMFSPSSPILEELFKNVCDSKAIEAYTLNSYENTLPRDMADDMEYQEQVELTATKTRDFYCQYGITTTPDLTSVNVLKAINNTSTFMTFEEKIEQIYPLLRSQGEILISDKAPFKHLSKTKMCITVSDDTFRETIKEKDFAIAVDSELNIYLQNELFPNHFAVLFCLFHSTLFETTTTTYLTEEKSVTETI